MCGCARAPFPFAVLTRVFGLSLLPRLYLAMLTQQRYTVTEKSRRYKSGLQKLYETNQVRLVHGWLCVGPPLCFMLCRVVCVPGRG